MLEPAQTIIQICGGFKAVADMTGRDETRVRRWTYSKDKGGTGGLIPSECQQVLMERAKERGLPLKPEHFFPAVTGGYAQASVNDNAPAQDGLPKKVGAA